MTAAQLSMTEWLLRVHYLSDGASWYRAATHGERVTLASLHTHGIAERKVWRPGRNPADNAHEYRISTVALDAFETTMSERFPTWDARTWADTTDGRRWRRENLRVLS